MMQHGIWHRIVTWPKLTYTYIYIYTHKQAHTHTHTHVRMCWRPRSYVPTYIALYCVSYRLCTYIAFRPIYIVLTYKRTYLHILPYVHAYITLHVHFLHNISSAFIALLHVQVYISTATIHAYLMHYNIQACMHPKP